jgi:hypothetical protein
MAVGDVDSHVHSCFLGVFAFCWGSFVKGPEIVSIKFLRQKNDFKNVEKFVPF